MGGIASIGSTVNNTMQFWKSVVDDYINRDDKKLAREAITAQSAQIKQQMDLVDKMAPTQIAQVKANLSQSNMGAQQSNTLFQNAQQDRATALRRNNGFLRGIVKGLQSAQAKKSPKGLA